MPGSHTKPDLYIAGRKSEFQRRNYDFLDLIKGLTEGLVGREEHLKQAKRWIRAHQEKGGILWVGGKPGVGKSAFMAKLATRLKGDGKLCVVPYFFRNGDTRCNPESFYQAAAQMLSEKFSLALSDGPETPQLHLVRLLELVRQGQSQETGSSTVVFLLDGLDEVAAQHPDFVRFPITLHHPRLVWICAGRNEPLLIETFQVMAQAEERASD